MNAVSQQDLDAAVAQEAASRASVKAAKAGDWTVDMQPIPEGGMGTFKIVF